MSHYLVGVILPFRYDGEKLHEAIAEILKPWDENDGDNENGTWDFWSLGGRWTGVWSDYDPEKDPANHKTCYLCGGTGLRNDAIAQEWRRENPEYTCNGCSSGPRPGTALKWPTQWADRPDVDLISVAEFLVREGTQIPYALCMAPDIWMARSTWDGDNWNDHPEHDEHVLALLTEHRDMYIAAVDVHS